MKNITLAQDSNSKHNKPCAKVMNICPDR